MDQSNCWEKAKPGEEGCSFDGVLQIKDVKQEVGKTRKGRVKSKRTTRSIIAR